MTRRRIALMAGSALVVALAVATAVALGAHGRRRSARVVPRSSASRARTVDLSCPAPALGGRLPARVYLPAGYTAGGPALPVVYFLHGLPAGPDSYTENAFVARALARAGRRSIVVAPQGARHAGSDPEYLDWSPTDDWPQAIAAELPACVDARFHTVRSRRGRALIGLSAGGYGAMNIGLRNLATFGVVESWSGYFAATDPSGHHLLKLGPAAARAAAVPRGAALAAELDRDPSLIGFYVGRGDDRFADDNQQYDRALTASRVGHVFRTYPGGHSGALWESEAPGWLEMAMTYLRTGRVTAP